MDGWIDGWMDGWMDGCMDAWMDGWMDGMDGWMDAISRLDMLRLLLPLRDPTDPLSLLSPSHRIALQQVLSSHGWTGC